VNSLSLQSTLCELFEVRVGESIPVAALNWFADTGERATQPLICFDPVSLVADMDHVLLYDSAQFSIEQEEAQQLVSTINNLVRDDGLQVLAPTPHRWYLQGKAAGDTRFTPIADVIGRNILPAMPAGDDAAWWRHLLNEIQMLLHSHKVNENRIARGLMPINGVWPWGNGEPERKGNAPFKSCSSDNVLVKGLARLQQVEYQSLPENFSAWLENVGIGTHLVELPLITADDAGALCDRLAAVERDWTTPLARALEEGVLQACTVYPGGSQGYEITSAQFTSVWRRLARRHKTLMHFCRLASTT
jgi:hypothetical protein